jgi:hypothetical protein
VWMGVVFSSHQDENFIPLYKHKKLAEIRQFF